MIIPLAGVVFLGVAFSVEQITVPLAGAAIGFGEAAIGRIASSLYAGLLLGCFLAGHAPSGLSREAAFGLAALLAGIAMVSYGAFPDPVVWMVCALVSGVAVAIMSVAVESWVSATAPRGSLAILLAVYLLIYDATDVVGPLAASILGPADLSTLSVSAFCAALAGLGVLLLARGRVVLRAEASGGPMLVLRLSPIAFAAAASGGLADAVVSSFGPISIVEKGFLPSAAAMMIAIGSALGMATHLPAGRLSDMWGRERAVVLALGLATAAAGLLWLAHAFWLSVLSVLAVIFLMAQAPLYGLAGAVVYARTPSSMHASLAAGLMMAYAMGGLVGPAAAGYAMEVLGSRALSGSVFIVLSGLLLGMDFVEKAFPWRFRPAI